MPVFFVSPQCVAAPTILITGDLLSHIRGSLRITIGETLWVGDGQGTRYHIEIIDITKKSASGRILETIQEPPQQTPRLILGQSLLKGEKMDWVIQKATELGINELVPLQSRYSVVQLKTDRVHHQLARWQRIAIEAAQQSEQWHVPTIAQPESLASLLAQKATGAVPLMLVERRKGTTLQAVALPQNATGSVLILIGPEGGWSQEEVQMAEQARIQSISLGPHILRSETAAIATISILQSRLGKLG
jgi:16S rRNA (uracil1498-N3)-methyltransferase